MNEPAATPPMARFAGRYELLKPLGHGAMGDVFLARDRATGSECALKRLRARPGADLAQIRKEFELLTQVRHPAVVSVLNFGVAPDGTPYYTMEYVRGAPADQAVQSGDWAAFFRVAAEATHALEALHAADVVHGDVKPGNLLVTRGSDGALAGVRLLDFGLASALGGGQAHRGTAGYAAPEVVNGTKPDRAADLYGLGATLYRLVAGTGAFGEESVAAVLKQQKQSAPGALPLESAGAPQGLVRLILRLMANEPRERPSDAREVRAELESMHEAARRPLDERLRRSVVVARERELARLERRLARAKGGSRVLVLTGPSGVGKSAVLGEIASRMGLAERPVVQLHGGSLIGPFEGARACLVALAAEAGEPIDAVHAESENDIAPLVERAVGLIEKLDERAAPVLIVDDVDRLDSLSRWFLRRVALHPKTARLVSIWSQASATAESSSDTAVLIDSGLAEEVAVGPLDKAGVDRLVAARFREPARESLVEFLWARAQGHPGFTVELLLHAVEMGAIREDATGLIADPEKLEQLGLPQTFEASLAARAAKLPEAARRAAHALAVVGRAMSVDRMRTIDDGIDVSALRALFDAGLARASDGGNWSLISPAFGERWVEALGDDDRRKWFGRALELPDLAAEDRFRLLRGAGDSIAALDAAEQAFEQNPNIALAESAAQLAESEAVDRAAVWHDRAAEALRERGRFKAVIPHLKRSLELGSEGRSEIERVIGLVQALIRLGRFKESAELIERGLQREPDDSQRTRLLINEAGRLQGQGQSDEAISASDLAIEHAKRTDDPRLNSSANITQVLLLRDLGELDEAEKAAQRAVSFAEASGEQVWLARATCTLGVVARARFQGEQAVKAYARALEIANRADARLAMEESLHGLAASHAELGQWESLRDANRQAIRFAVEDGRQLGVAMGVTALSTVEGLTGRPRATLKWARSAIRLTRRHAPWLEANAWRTRSMGLAAVGRYAGAVRAAEHAFALAQRLNSKFEIEWARIEYARALIGANRWSEVSSAVGRSDTRADSIGSTILQSLAGRAALRRGDEEVARSRLQDCEGWLESHTAPYAVAFTDQLRAELAIRAGSDEAPSFADRCLEKFIALPAMSARAEAALGFGELALESGQGLDSEAIGWLDIASAIFERLGNLRGRERALSGSVSILKRASKGSRNSSGERDVLTKVSGLLNSLTDLNQLTKRAMELVARQLDAERGVLLLMDEDTKRLNPIYDHGAIDAESRQRAITFSRRVVRDVVESGGSTLIGDAVSEPGTLSESMVDLRLRSIVCVPMFLGGRVIGAVYLDDSRRAEAFNEKDRSLLEGFAQLMAVAIDKSRAHEQVQQTNEALLGEAISLRQKASHQFQAHRLIGTSQALQRVLGVVERTAASPSTVLLTGENGTGKELIARILHSTGKRKLRPFIAVNCGAIPETLLETELFGILPNIATDVKGRPGKFQLADTGTLFLDEVGDMPLSQQVALLSVLANREITPVGGMKSIPVDVRLIAATNRNLRKMVQQGEFREDLYYRLNVIPIEVPPLRERKADIPALAQYFAAEFAAEQDREVPELSPEFLAALMQSDWPGNIREMRNYLERVMAMNPGNVLYPSPLPRDLEERGETVQVGKGQRLTDMIEDLERRLVLEALSRAGGNQSLAARELGIPEQAIRYRMKKYRIPKSREIRRIR